MGILITDTTLRDAHQSLIATRMRTRDMLPIAVQLDKVGFFSIEMWGGATFDACIRFLNEDPWDRLKELRSKVKHTRLQMLLRGQNLVGYRHYADDVLREFVRLSSFAPSVCGAPALEEISWEWNSESPLGRLPLRPAAYFS